MTIYGKLFGSRTVPKFVKVEDLPKEFRPIGTALNTGDKTIEDLCREIKALEITVENLQSKLQTYRDDYVHKS
jgi:archaellum component FlaC